MGELSSLSLDRYGRVVVATIAGEIDFSNADDLGRRIAGWMSNEEDALVLDLVKLSYSDSAGINLVFDLAARLREHGQAIAIVLPVDSQPWRAFSIVGMESQVPIFETLEEAEAGVRNDPEP